MTLTQQKFNDLERDIDDTGKFVNAKKMITPRYGDSFKSAPLIAQELAENGLFQPFKTEVELKANVPIIVPTVAKALDTKKVWIYEQTSAEGIEPKTFAWHDTGLSEEELANQYTDEKTAGYEQTHHEDYVFTVEDDIGRSPLRIGKTGVVEADLVKVKELNGADENSVDTIKALNSSNDLHVFAITDADDNAALAVNNDGSTQVHTLKVGSIQSTGATADITAKAEVFAFAITDKDDNVSLAVHKDGTFEVAKLLCKNIVGFEGASSNSNQFKNPYFLAELVYINNAGQSLGEGSNGDVTVVQEFDNIGFPWLSINPTLYKPATVENCEAYLEGWMGDGGRGEFPGLGALGFIKERIESENKITFQQQKYQLLIANNAIGGKPLTALNKGTAAYNASMSQIQSAYNIAQTEDRTFKVGAQFWTQGEGGPGPASNYATLFKQYAEDYNVDAKAITSQTEDVPLICYQTPTNTDSALAQLAVHDSSELVTIATPIYHLSYYDPLHIDAASSKILGCYYGLVYKRIAVDRQKWEPLRPEKHTIQGKILNVWFKTPVEPLAFDTFTVPMQTNYGFYLIDEDRNNIPISKIELVGPNSLKIVASAPIPPNSKLKYAVDGSTGKGDWYGSAGNLRDSQGDEIKYQATPLHNWCVHFEYQL